MVQVSAGGFGMVPEVDGVRYKDTVLAGDADEVVDEGGAAKVLAFGALI